MERWVGTAGVFFVGLFVGSFLNVCIYRLPREQSIVRPRSHCFFCGTPLSLWDLIPVGSYLWLKGKCRYCGVLLSSRYLWGELATGLALGLLYLRHGPSLEFCLASLAACALIPIFAIDLEHRIIPHELNWAMAGVGFLRDGLYLGLGRTEPFRLPWPGGTGLPLPASVAGALTGWLLLLLIVHLGRWWFRQEAMGGGDLRFAVAAGAYFGPGNLTLLLLLAIVSGAVVGVMLILLRRRKRRDYIPFGPFLTAAAYLLLLYPRLGSDLWRAYWGTWG